MQSNLFKVRKKNGINKEYALCTLKWKKLKNMNKKSFLFYLKLIFSQKFYKDLI